MQQVLATVMVMDSHCDPGDFVCLFHKCFHFGQNVILGFGSGKFHVVGGGIKGKAPRGGTQRSACLHQDRRNQRG